LNIVSVIFILEEIIYESQNDRLKMEKAVENNLLERLMEKKLKLLRKAKEIASPSFKELYIILGLKNRINVKRWKHRGC
jgi:hypothetical protein